MNHKSVFASMLIAVALLIGMASTASAYYDSEQGRFISRDPINTVNQPNMAVAQSPNVFAAYPRVGQIVPAANTGPVRVGGVAAPQPKGRMIKRDPVEKTSYADGMNLYQYVHSNPLINVDPSGLLAWPWPLNSRICNKSSDMCLITWSDSTGYSLLKPGECTSFWKDHGDFAYWNSDWFKCRGGHTCYIDDREISEYPNDPDYLPPVDEDSVKDNWHPGPASEEICKQHCDCNEKSSKHGSMKDKCECIKKCMGQE